MLKLLITTEEEKLVTLTQPCHPGEILKYEFLLPLELSAGQLANRIGVPRSRIERLVKETSPITIDTALRLARFFGSTPQFWLNLQNNFDVANTSIEIEGIQPLERIAM